MIEGMSTHEGMLLLIEGKIYKVISAVLRGSGQAHKAMHLGLKSIPEGNFIEKVFNPGEKVEEIAPERSDMQYLYKDGSDYYFMNVTTFEQLAIPETIVGHVGPYLKENVHIQVEFHEGRPMHVIFPRVIQMKVISSPQSVHEGSDTTYKEVTLENDIKILVPQFIKENDLIEVDTQTGKYVDRVKK